MKNICSILKKVEVGFIAACLAGMVAVIFIATIARFSSLFTTPWAEELSRYLMIWLAFVGSGVVARHGLHFGVDVLVKRVPGKKRTIMYVINIILVSAICIWIAYYGFIIIRTQVAMHRTSPSMSIPMWLVTLCVPYTAISTGLQNLYYEIQMIRQCIGKKPEDGSDEISAEGGAEV